MSKKQSLHRWNMRTTTRTDKFIRKIGGELYHIKEENRELKWVIIGLVCAIIAMWIT